MVSGTAIILTNGLLKDRHAKTAHGLLRGGKRFQILAVVDSVHAGKDIRQIIPSLERKFPIYKNISETLENLSNKPDYCIIGVALHGGILPDSFRRAIIQAIKSGISIVSGLHTHLSNDPEFNTLAMEHQVELIDVRKSPPLTELHFWEGDSLEINIPRIALLGMDCVIGKRTTGNLLKQVCQKNGIRTELIYTGQTGWMQGLKYGFIFDAIINDFIGGEIEKQIMLCTKEAKPDLILLEGQSSLRNPSGPCGAEFLLAGNCKGVILQHAPGRKYFDGMENLKFPIPPVEEEIKIIKMYGAKTLAVTLNEENMTDGQIRVYQDELQNILSIPVIRPFKGELSQLVPIISTYIEEYVN
jgi:uncharacterized NAD-dependent epimerase/dehydratase family protein